MRRNTDDAVMTLLYGVSTLSRHVAEESKEHTAMCNVRGSFSQFKIVVRSKDRLKIMENIRYLSLVLRSV